MAHHPAPKKNGYIGNICAFCNRWEGHANLRSYTSSMVDYDDKARGICLNNRSTRVANVSACQKFELSPNASRYAK